MTSPPSLSPPIDGRAPGARRTQAPRGSRLASFWTLFGLTLRQHLHGKRWMVMAFLFLLPAGLAILVRSTAPDVPLVGLEFMLAFMFLPQAVIPLVALLYASGMIQDEQEEQTITYLLIRPIPKWAIYTIKLLATIATTVVLVALATVLIYGSIYLGADAHGENIPFRCLKAAGIHSLAAVAYCCLFGLLSLMTQRTLIVGVLYTAVFEVLLANMPFGVRLATVSYYTRLIAYRLLTFVAPPPRRAEDIAAAVWHLDVRKDPQLLEYPQIGTCVTVLLVASLVCTVLAAVICSRKEFHVKTPEKN
jgi:ABC-2 type transport system permease protein